MHNVLFFPPMTATWFMPARKVVSELSLSVHIDLSDALAHRIQIVFSVAKGPHDGGHISPHTCDVAGLSGEYMVRVHRSRRRSRYLLDNAQCPAPPARRRWAWTMQ